MHRYLIGLLSLLVLLQSPLSGQLKGLKKKAAKTIKQQIKPLEIDFSVTAVKYNPLKSPNKLKLTVLFEGENPNKLGVKLNRIEFDLFVNDKFAAKFYNDKKIEIPKKGSFEFEETATLKISTVGKTVFNAVAKKKAVYRIDGTYFVDTRLGTFTLKATLVEKEH